MLGALWSGGPADDTFVKTVDDELEAAPARQPAVREDRERPEQEVQEREPEQLTKRERARQRELAEWRAATAIVEENRRYLESELRRVVPDNLEQEEDVRLQQLNCFSRSIERARRAVLNAQPRTFRCFFTYSDRVMVDWAPYVVSPDGANWYMQE